MLATRPPLTSRQEQIYEFLKDQIRNRGFAPTIQEIGKQFGIRSPSGVAAHLKALQRKGFITRESRRSRAIQLSEPLPAQTSIRLAGRISAGNPMLLIERSERVDFTRLFQLGDHYCLQVMGDSLVEEQIASGDYVVVRPQDSCAEGEIVVALVDNNQTTLKRFYREKDQIRLEPANGAMKPIYSDNVKVLGVVVGLVRQY
ncbi:MAG TPA: transcriptional repressor LexA [Planctomycetaceae bacterium]|nr:transcriptional repressor LexA [Planctomycetaceae bacterium]